MKVDSRNHRRYPLLVILGSVVVLSLVGLAFGLTWPSLIEAQSTLPPRQTPTLPPPKDKKRESDKPLGATIELQVQPVPAGDWGVVQWQDKSGNWHDVDGWKGALGATGLERWWVAAKDFNTGPFRWVVTQGPGGPEVAASQPFNLPARANEILRIEVTVK